MKTKERELIEKQRELINYLKHHYDVNSPLWDDQCVTSLKMETEIKQLESEQEQLIKKQREKILNILINNIHLLSDDSYTYGLEEDDFDCISNEILTALEAEIAKEKDEPSIHNTGTDGKQHSDMGIGECNQCVYKVNYDKFHKARVAFDKYSPIKDEPCITASQEGRGMLFDKCEECGNTTFKDLHCRECGNNFPYFGVKEKDEDKEQVPCYACQGGGCPVCSVV
jgi:hypothetical protein